MIQQRVLDRIKKRFKKYASSEELRTFSLFDEVVEKIKHDEEIPDELLRRLNAIPIEVYKKMKNTFDSASISVLCDVLDDVERRLERIESKLTIKEE